MGFKRCHRDLTQSVSLAGASLCSFCRDILTLSSIASFIKKTEVMGKESVGCLVFAGKEDQTRQEADQPEAEMVSTKRSAMQHNNMPYRGQFWQNKGPSVSSFN